MPVQLELIGSQAVRRGIEHLSSVEKAFQLAPRALVHQAAVLYRRALKDKAPVRSGRLRDSIGFRTIATSSGAAARFHAAQHAIFVIKGTRAHEIWAGLYTGRSSKSVLAFSIGGRQIFTPYVRHPGTLANDFRAKAWSESREEVRGVLRQTGRGILRGDLVGAEVGL